MNRKNRILALAVVPLLIVMVGLLPSCSQGYKKQTGLTAEEMARLEYARRMKWDGFPGKYAFFDYDKYNIRPEAARSLKLVAETLKAHPDVRVEIQGHCDERGSEQYNIQLGVKRAEAAKKFLISQGIAADRMKTVSYGKDRPLVEGRGEKSWAQNRRVEFVKIK